MKDVLKTSTARQSRGKVLVQAKFAYIEGGLLCNIRGKIYGLALEDRCGGW